MPWNARNAASMYIEVDIMHSSEPTTNTAMAKRKNGLRPYWSESLPYSGVEIVDVIRNAVVTHACAVRPSRLSPIL